MNNIFSIIIPTLDNFDYLKLCIGSINKNSTFKHQIVVHVNGNNKKTEDYLKNLNIVYSKTEKNVGLCTGVNLASKKATTNYILYSHDDMYYLPRWDEYLLNEVNNLNTNLFYLSMTQISSHPGVKGDLQHIYYDCGDNIENFNQKKLLNNFDKFEFRDLQGSHWAPHLIHKDIWNKVGGFSEEFNPGFASDPDLNRKLWSIGVRIFKGISKSRLYHFGSLTTRKNKTIKINNGKKTFLLKWNNTVEFFTKHYLRRGDTYDGPLEEPKKNLIYFIDFFISKLKYCFTKFFK